MKKKKKKESNQNIVSCCCCCCCWLVVVAAAAAVVIALFLSEPKLIHTENELEITVPNMGDSITEGTIGSWHKQVGDSVEMDEVVVSIETDKVTQEIKAPEAGKITGLHAEADETVCFLVFRER